MNNSKPISPSSLPAGRDTSGAGAKKAPLRERSPVLAHLRSIFIAGLLSAIPLFITIYIIGFFYGFATTYTRGLSDWLVGHIFQDSSSTLFDVLRSIASGTVAVLFAVLFVYILGLLGTFFIGRQILAQFEHFIENLPLIKGIYGTTKQVMAVFRQGGGGSGFQRVVLVEFPRQGTWTIAFVTNTIRAPGLVPMAAAAGASLSATTAPASAPPASDGKLVCCFIPMTPNPTSGFFQMFPEDQVRNTDWSVDMGIKIVLSGGLLAPQELQETKPSA